MLHSGSMASFFVAPTLLPRMESGVVPPKLTTIQDILKSALEYVSVSHYKFQKVAQFWSKLRLGQKSSLN